jgi:hypothetical protein
MQDIDIDFFNYYDRCKTAHDTFYVSQFLEERFAKSLFTIMLGDDVEYFDLTTLTVSSNRYVSFNLQNIYVDLTFHCKLIVPPFCDTIHIAEHKSGMHNEVIFQLMKYDFTLIERHRNEIENKSMPFPALWLILQGDAKKINYLSELAVNAPTNLFTPPLLHINIFRFADVTDAQINARWPDSLPILVMRDYKNPDIIEILDERIDDILHHHNSDYFFDRHIADSLAYIFSISSKFHKEKIFELTQKISGGREMDYGNYLRKNLNSVLVQIGETRGREEGREEGMQEGLQKGMQKGMQEGREEALQDAVLHLATQRYPEAAAESLGAKIRSIHDRDWLLTLLSNIPTSASFQAFEQEVDMTLQRQGQMV